MTSYVDASVLIRFLLEHPQHLHLPSIQGEFICSELTVLECKRVLIRYRLDGEFTDDSYASAVDYLEDILKRIKILKMNSNVFKKALVNWGIVLGSLDSLHLASALLYQEETGIDVQILTHDKVLGKTAKLMNLKVLGID